MCFASCFKYQVRIKETYNIIQICGFYSRKPRSFADISSRSGLKAIHKDFSGVFDRLDKTYTTFKSNDAIAGCVIAIYAKMCADTKLRDRLFQEKGKR